MPLATQIPTGQTFVINGAIVRFVDSTTKKINLSLAAPDGGLIEFRAATEAEKSLTYQREQS